MSTTIPFIRIEGVPYASDAIRKVIDAVENWLDNENADGVDAVHCLVEIEYVLRGYGLLNERGQ
jgi:hypothetical protein